MKRLIALVLAMVMALSLCACGPANQTEGTEGAGDGLQVGFAKINITPSYSHGLSGYSNAETRKSQGFVDYIYATCIAMTDGPETILLYTVDSIAFTRAEADYFRDLITRDTGIAGEKIFISATHCHSCPEKSGQYKQDMGLWMIEAANKALEDRVPATISATTTDIEGMNFVRHYKMEDGSYAGANFGDFSKKIVGHVEGNDPQMVLVQFDRAEEKKDVVLVNWQAHPDFSTYLGFNLIAADFIGPLRDELERLSGAQVAYFTGASGNLVCLSKVTEENKFKGIEWREYGTEMGKLAYEGLAGLKPVEGSGIETRRRMVSVDIDRSWDHMLEQANEVYDLWKSAGDEAGAVLAKSYGFTSVFQARAIRDRTARGTTEELQANAFHVGGIGFASCTYEMFAQNGAAIKENSPYEITLVISSNSSYIPNDAAFEYRCYEADTGFYARGTAERMVDNFVEMLKEMQ